jgi:predicted dehydrogenase
VCNLTIPAAHADVSLAAIAAGRHVYVEKPLAASRADAAQVLAAAEDAGVLVGGAPDTFLGSALQLCRALLDDGVIGDPVSAAAEWTSPGHESWHPDPGFFYRPGGGPLFDMGPYYLTALVSLLGPVREVAATTTKARAQRTVPTGPRAGERIDVEVPTHVSGLLRFAAGATATIVTSFDVHGGRPPRLDLHGTEGTLRCPDPNLFDLPVGVFRADDGEWSERVPSPTGDRRGLGLADLADAARTGRPARASAALAFHVLDVMESLHEAGEAGEWVRVGSTVERPAPVV